MTLAIILHRADGAPITTTFPKTSFGETDRFAEHRDIAWDGPDVMAGGRVNFAGELRMSSFAHTETIVVVNGELTSRSSASANCCLEWTKGSIAQVTALAALAALHAPKRYNCR